jgi:sodium/hydrogen antiporter
VALFSTGLKLDRRLSWREWGSVVRLLGIVMPLTIVALALFGGFVMDLSLAAAIVLGAALAPTDPVLAGDVQVGPPLEGSEHPVRFALTTEAGLNDGFAFPFVYLGLLIAAGITNAPADLAIWFLRDALYPIAAGALLGAAIGWALGKTIVHMSTANRLARAGPGVIALAAVLLCYGLVALAEANGFIGAFVAGLVYRRIEAQNEFHRRLHTFSDAIESAVTAILLVMLGSTLPALWPVLDWRHTLIGFGLLLVIRPLTGYVSLIGTDLTRHERWAVAFFGVRGVGTIYYIAYASGMIEFVNEEPLWALTAYTIFASTVVHGATSFVVDRIAPIDGQKPQAAE